LIDEGENFNVRRGFDVLNCCGGVGLRQFCTKNGKKQYIPVAFARRIVFDTTKMSGHFTIKNKTDINLADSGESDLVVSLSRKLLINITKL